MGGKETGKRVIPPASEMPIKGIIKSLWNKEKNIKMVFQKQKEGQDIIGKYVFAV